MDELTFNPWSFAEGEPAMILDTDIEAGYFDPRETAGLSIFEGILNGEVPQDPYEYLYAHYWLDVYQTFLISNYDGSPYDSEKITTLKKIDEAMRQRFYELGGMTFADLGFEELTTDG